MDFAIPKAISADKTLFDGFLSRQMTPNLASWNEQGEIPRSFFRQLGAGGWLGFEERNGEIVEQSALKQALLYERLAEISAGVAVAVLVHVSLGSLGLNLFAGKSHREKELASALRGETLVCLGNSEPLAGSDVAGIKMTAQPVSGGWLLNGVKAYATNGSLSDLAIVTAVSDPSAPRNGRLSMFLVDLNAAGVSRKKLNKQVWIPSDLTRIMLKDVWVPADHLLGERGRGLQQVLQIFTHSRLTISALTLGTAVGAFKLALQHAGGREIFGQKLLHFQAKSFEMAHHFSKIEAARLMLWKACWLKDQGQDFRLEASMAKYLTVEIAREVSAWAADLFGAASVIADHPIHKFPMDAWASSLGEGTQDVQKLIIFRELLKRFEEEKTEDRLT